MVSDLGTVRDGGKPTLKQHLAVVPPLSRGSHGPSEHAMCVMEAVAFVSGEAWSDHPSCVCPVITAFLVNWNDSLPDDERDTLLRPLIPLVVGTRNTQQVERRRALMAVDWLVREHTPAWLRLAGLTSQADALAGLPAITDYMAQCPSLMPTLMAVRQDAGAAGAAARAAAGAAARAAARAAAWDAAGAAAGAAAWDAAWDAARDAAGAAARGAAWDAAGAAAWDAAGAAAWDAAGAAAWDALKPTTASLQQSALALVHRMIACSAHTA
jgi:hypothetical protein